MKKNQNKKLKSVKIIVFLALFISILIAIFVNINYKKQNVIIAKEKTETSTSSTVEWEYDLENGKIVNLKCANKDSISGNITIPSEIDGYEVKEIGDEAFLNCKNLTGVIIPNTVTLIGKYAFAGTGLVEIEIPESVLMISSFAFNDCSNLIKMTILGDYCVIEFGIIGANLNFYNDGVVIYCNKDSYPAYSFAKLNIKVVYLDDEEETEPKTEITQEDILGKWYGNLVLDIEGKSYTHMIYFDIYQSEGGLKAKLNIADLNEVDGTEVEFNYETGKIIIKPKFYGNVFVINNINLTYIQPWIIEGTLDKDNKKINCINSYFNNESNNSNELILQRESIKEINIENIGDSEFKIEENNNFFTNGNFDQSDGFYNEKNYRLDKEYYNKLIKQENKSGIDKIKKVINDEWAGSCYGIAETMGLVKNGMLTVNELTGKNEKNYSSIEDKPYENSQLLNVINYFFLSQNTIYDSHNLGNSKTYVDSFFGKILEGASGSFFSSKKDDLKTFLNKIIQSSSQGKISVLCYRYKNGGHAILVVGCKYDKENQNYMVKLYDENFVNDTYKGNFMYMIIDKDCTKFSIPEPGVKCIDNSNYYYMDFMELDKINGLVYNLQGKYQNIDKETSNTTKISFDSKSKFTTKNSQNETLSYDSENGFSGDIKVKNIDVNVKSDFSSDEDSTELVVEVEKDDNFVITDLSENIDISIYDDENYKSIEGSGIESMEVTVSDDVKIDGDQYTYKIFTSIDEDLTENEGALISVSGDAEGETVLDKQEDRVEVNSAKNMKNISIKSYVQNEVQDLENEGTEKDILVTNEEIMERAEEMVKIEGEPLIESDEYEITQNEIVGVKAGTKLSELKEKCNIEGTINVYKDENKIGEENLIGTGMKVEITKGTKKKIMYIAVTGDVTGDGRITTADLTRLRGDIYEGNKLEEIYLKAMDIDKNGKITTADLTSLRGAIYEGNII